MKFIIVLLLFFLFLKSAAQKQNIRIKFCPAVLIDDISFSAIQGGLEFKLSDRLTLYNELGIKYRKSYIDNTDTSFIKLSGYKIKTEIRYYLQRMGKSMFDGFYCGANAFLHVIIIRKSLTQKIVS